MAKVLVTGGTGMLGSVLVPALGAARHEVRVLSRRARPSGEKTYVVGDLTNGEGIEAALAGVDVVIHAATSPFRRTGATDIEGTASLLSACAASGVEHVVFPSIVGVDRHPFRYYRAKWAAEQIVEAGAVPWTIARATQFHPLLDMQYGMMTRFPVLPVPPVLFQPLDIDEYATVLVDLVGAGPSGRAPDTGGPAVRTMRQLLQAWLEVHQKRRATVPVPAVGRILKAFRDGVHTCPARAVGTVTWEDHLARRGRGR